MIEHAALLYRDREELLDGVARFVHPGVEAGEAVLIALPPDRLEPLRARLGAAAGAVELLDMGEAGGNPGRLIPAFHECLDRSRGRPVHLVGEPIWEGRTAGEVREATRHEALVNLAFAEAPVRALCPYDARALAPAILDDARRTHPTLVERGVRTASAGYGGPSEPVSCCGVLPQAPEPVTAMAFGEDDLPELRALVAVYAAASQLPRERAEDLVLAVNEAATNSIRHAGAGGTLRVWAADGRMTCEISDDGHIEDPLAGRCRPGPAARGGRGLWLIHHLCDLVETRTGPAGTVLRLHACLP